MKSYLSRGMGGALAGVAGAFAMYQFRLAWERRTKASPQSGIFGFDEEADINSVDELSSLLALPPLSREEALQAALVLHFAYGALSGLAYGVVAEKFPLSKAGHGTLFGTLLWLFGDELAMTVSGLSNPRIKTSSSHLSALVAHLLFGAVTELCRKASHRAIA